MFCSEIVHGRRECRYFFFLGILPELKKKCFGSSQSYISDLELCFLIFSG